VNLHVFPERIREVLAEGNCGRVTNRERKPECKAENLWTETAYKANGPDEVAPHTEAPGSGSVVNAEVVQPEFAFLSGENSMPCAPGPGSGTTGNRWVEDGGVSRGHSTAEAKAGRPKPVGCGSTREPRSATQTPYRRAKGPDASAGKYGATQANLLDRTLARENVLLAWQRVKANKGAAGMDDMSICSVRGLCPRI
jgi:hypothetical protein